MKKMSVWMTLSMVGSCFERKFRSKETEKCWTISRDSRVKEIGNIGKKMKRNRKEKEKRRKETREKIEAVSVNQ